MRRYEGLEAFSPPAAGTALCIGAFDGVHRGHQALLRKARQEAERFGAEVVAVTFEPHPLAVLRPDRAPPRLTTAEEKLALLAQAGADGAIVLASEPALFEQAPATFLQRIVDACRPRAVVEGPTFRFGRGRSGSIDTLRDFARAAGFEAHVLDELRASPPPDAPVINSSAVRALVHAGRVQEAAEMLGRLYRITGVVGGDDQRGAALGFPTANLDHIPQLAPGEGVFAAAAQLEGGELWPAAVNIGPQPTFDQYRSRVEAHLLGFRGELHGQRVGLYFHSRLRDQQRFENVPALVAQLERDVQSVRDLVDVETIRAASPIPVAS